MISTIPNDLLQAIHDYLMTKPMREVEGFVVAIRQDCKPIGGDEKEPAK